MSSPAVWDTGRGRMTQSAREMERGAGLGNGTGQVLDQIQGIGIDGVTVLAEQLGQPGLTLVAAHHPDIQFMLHGNVHLRNRPAGRRVSALSYAGKRRGCREDGGEKTPGSLKYYT